MLLKESLTRNRTVLLKECNDCDLELLKKKAKKEAVSTILSKQISELKDLFNRKTIEKKENSMFKHEFLKKMREYGINLEDYQIVIDEYVPVSYFLGVCKGKNKWIIYEVGDRNNVDIMYEESSKNKIFEEFYQEVLERLHSLGYVTMHISKQVIQTPKKYVCNFLQKKYRISKFDAEDIWNDLKYDFHVLNEVKLQLFDLFKGRSRTSFERFEEWITKKVEVQIWIKKKSWTYVVNLDGYLIGRKKYERK